ncbi:uncharacterized protein LOC133812291 isoform X2 [Humulus lupulus]|nr:uncharacterized protein LOC133812291 isoform X2 [Humulus lupulus]
MSATTPRSKYKAALLNLILKHCQLQMHNIDVQVQFPMLSGSCMLCLKELNAKSQYLNFGCFFRGLVGAPFLPVKESSFVISVGEFEIVFKMVDQSNHILSSTDLFTCIKLNDFQLVDFNLRVPELILSCSPLDLSMGLAFSDKLSKEPQCPRNGRDLWKLAASRVGHVTSTPRLTFHKLVVIVGLWLRYVKAYEDLLKLVGYSIDYLLKGSTTQMSQNKLFSRSFTQLWKVIIDAERELPAESIAQARRIARYRAAANVQSVKLKESDVDTHLRLFCMIFALLRLIWKLILKLFHFIVYLLFFRRKLAKELTDEYLEIVTDDSSMQFCFILNLGRIYVNISQLPAVKKLESQIGVLSPDFISLSLSTKGLLLKYVEDICEQSLTVSCGKFKVKSSSFMEPHLRQGSSKDLLGGKRHWKENRNDIKSILWCKPAHKFPLSETSNTAPIDNAEGACGPFLENFLGEMWLNWKKTCMKLEGSEMEYSEDPCLLCETKSFLTYPDLRNLDSGISKCFFTLGKLQFDLGPSSVLSISVLLRQIEHALCRTKDIGISKVASHSPRTVEDPSEIKWDNRYKYYSSSLSVALLKILPEKHIQIGVFIAGPCIKLCLEKEFSSGNEVTSHMENQDELFLAFDVNNIEVAFWPSSKPNSSSVVVHSENNDAEPECTTLKQHQIIDIPKSNNEKFVVDWWILLGSYLRINGLNIYLGDNEEKQKHQILCLLPMTVQFSSSREYFHSFSTNVNAISASLCVTATGLTILSCMDELYAVSQVVVNLYSAVSHVFSSFDFIRSIHSESNKQKCLVTKSVNEEAISKEAPSICSSILFLVEGILKIKSVDVVLQKTRINDDVESSMKTFNALSSSTFADLDLPDYGILISIQQTSVDLSCEEERMEILTDFGEIQSVIYEYQKHKGEYTDISEFRDLLLQSHKCSYEISVPNCTFLVSLFLSQNVSSSRTMHSKLSGSSYKSYMDKLSFTIDSEKSASQNSIHVEKLRFVSNIPEPDPSHWLFVNVAVGIVYVGSCSLKNALFGAHDLNKLLSSLYVGGEVQTISCGIQGGTLFLETTALETFISCVTAYLRSIANITSNVHPMCKEIENIQCNVDITRMDDDYVNEQVQGTLQTPLETEGKQIQGFTVNFSRFSTVAVVKDEKGGVRELVLKFDVLLKFELTNIERKFMFDLKTSILSQVLRQSSGNELDIPQFYSETSNNTLTHFEYGDCASELQQRNVIHELNDPSCSRNSDSPEQLSVENCVPKVSNLSSQKYILKQLGASFSVQKPVNGPICSHQSWVGRGSISGFNIIISLSEIEMILIIVSSFSGVFSKTTTSDLNKKQRSSNQEDEPNSIKAMVPDGSIVAIQDVHQHMYLAVDGEHNKYSLVGTAHYSLVGERALFRVKHHHQRKWGSSVLWFAFLSLHAKNDLGEPFRLNYCQGSGFVDISGTDDSGGALWGILPCKPQNYDSDIDWEPYNQLVKRTSYLVNKKNDCAIAVVDGVPEFVRKPGSPFKFKVFLEPSVAQDVGKSHLLEDSSTSLQDNASMFKGRTSGHNIKLPCIDIEVINKISLTIIHKLSNTSGVFPLLRASIDTTKLIVQVMSTKTRVITTLIPAIYHFDSQRNSWRELLHPVEIFLFYRSSFHTEGSEVNLAGVPVHIHCRTKELNISLSELSLDALLFVVGKLNLAGPYLLKNSRILANCCMVKNESGITLLCHFLNKRSLKIARNQSTSIFLRRYEDLENPSQEVASMSFQLAALGSFMTSLVPVSLLQTQEFAWRTSIMSSQDSKTYPGPFIVVDVSKESEEGLSITVSPLIRIHNGTRFSLELRFQRPQQNVDESASLVLKPGDTMDDSMAMFDSVHLSGGLKKALNSLSLGNFLFSFRPNITEEFMSSKDSLSVEWSHDLKGGKAVCLSGVFDKLSYKVRQVFTESAKCSFSSAQCSLKSEGSHIADIHFLIQSFGRDIPVRQSSNSKEGYKNSTSPEAIQEQKEIFLLPTVNVSNLLESEIHVLLTEMDPCSCVACDNTENQAKLSPDSSLDFYVNPSIIYFTVTLTALSSSCKPVNSGDWVKKLQKQKSKARYLDIDLDFDGGKYFASLRMSRGHKGILEATVFTSYTLKNDTDVSIYIFPPNRKPLARHDVENLGSDVFSEFGLLLHPKSTRSWFLKSNKVCLKLLEDNASEAQLDLDALSGLTEISLEMEENNDVKFITKLGVSMGPLQSKAVVPSQLVTMVPRYVVVNESEESICVRQCYLQYDRGDDILVNSKQRATLQLSNVMVNKRELSFFESLLRKHRKDNDDALLYIQFKLNQPDSVWSGPICIASLGRFFLKFREQRSGQMKSPGESKTTFAAVHVVEEGSTLVLHYHSPPNVNLPYRIENYLPRVSITYHQKDLLDPEVLVSGSTVNYVWDDLTLPRKLVVKINDSSLPRDINLDKVRAWKPFHKLRHRVLAHHFLTEEISENSMPNSGELDSINMAKVGYEVYTDGPTRVLRFCEYSNRQKVEKGFQACEKIQLRVPQFTIHLLEQGKQDGIEDSSLHTIISARFGNFCLDSVFTNQHKYNQINLQSLILEQKWVGAPFAAMLRKHQVDYTDSNDCILRIVLVLLSTNTDVIQVQYSSIALQPVDLNLDEETLMKIVPFWRTSLSDSNTKSRQFYFDHFEIHPIKIIANFLPGDSYSSYSSSQETLRSLLHSVIKVPPIKNKVVELNGVLVTHALITMRELFFRCAQHYSWYSMRAIYIAKGSPLLPPDFVSMFDDLSSSSLDVFFDPSRGLMNLPRFTLGTFKLLSKCIGGKGSSGTKRYFGDLEKSLRTAGSNVLFAAVTEISDSVLKGAEANGFNGMVTGFHQGILKLAMEPSLLGSALMEGGPDRKIKLDRSAGVDELYIEGYLQAMLDTLYRQEYLRVRVIDNQVFLKNLPPNNTLIEEIVDHVKSFLVSKALLKSDPSKSSRPLRHLQGESEWKLGPTLLTLCEHLFVSFAIRKLRKEANKFISGVKQKIDTDSENIKAITLENSPEVQEKVKFVWKWGVGKFVLSGIVAYIDGRLCRRIPNPVARRIVSGFLLTFLDQNTDE